MTRTLSILATVMLAASIGSVSTGQAQDKTTPGAKCGMEEWSNDKMAYTSVPCAGDERPSNQSAQAPGAKPCGLEVWSTDKLIYETLPCAAGLTEENPGRSK